MLRSVDSYIDSREYIVKNQDTSTRVNSSCKWYSPTLATTQVDPVRAWETTLALPDLKSLGIFTNFCKLAIR